MRFPRFILILIFLGLFTSSSYAEDEAAKKSSRKRPTPVETIDDEDRASFNLGVHLLKPVGPMVSFASLQVLVSLTTNVALDLNILYALRSNDPAYFFGGGGLSYFFDRALRDFHLSFNGGLYFGSGLSESIPAGRLLLGWRFLESSWSASLGIAAGPEFWLAGSGPSAGLAIRIDLGFPW